jgi:DNA replication and repair protein RecF
VLTKVVLTNFRNYIKAEVGVSSDLVLILGDNAAGKTNFLESIYFLSRLKSFRAPDMLLIRQGEDYFRVNATFDESELEGLVQILPKPARQFKINGQKTKRSLWQSYRSVLFNPNDLNLFILGPAFRRKYLDETLSQQGPVYNLSLASLDHDLKQRLALLQSINKGLASRSELDFWNKELAAVSLILKQEREKFLEFLNQRFNATMISLMGFEHKYSIEFLTFERIKTEEEFLAELSRLADAEIRSGKNLLGPHRDDFLIKKNGEANLYNSSRGELRSQILALKLLQAEYLSTETDKPIILLDDVFSELDETRRTKLIENLKGHQIFITSTEEHHLPQIAKDSLILRVENNEIK